MQIRNLHQFCEFRFRMTSNLSIHSNLQLTRKIYTLHQSKKKDRRINSIIKRFVCQFVEEHHYRLIK
jgi:hypothetical protein